MALLIFTILCNHYIFPKHLLSVCHRYPLIYPVSVNLLLIFHVSEIMPCFSIFFFFFFLTTLLLWLYQVSAVAQGSLIALPGLFTVVGEGVSCFSTGGILVSSKGLNCVPCVARWILNHCTTKEVPYPFFSTLQFNLDFSPNSFFFYNLFLESNQLFFGIFSFFYSCFFLYL